MNLLINTKKNQGNEEKKLKVQFFAIFIMIKK